MTCARKSLVSLGDTPYYHVVARCVRRAWLWGVDEYAGRNYSHRKHWVIQRLQQLSSVFAVDICAYAVMSNHYHLVVHVDRSRARAWTTQEVTERWSKLFTLPDVIERWQEGLCESFCERAAAEALVERWRQRLHDISWYMRCLNEHLARRANAEDGVKGRFWEGRFRSQALLDEAGLLVAMAYVDLNPIRAGIAVTPESSEFTSVHERIQEIREARSRRISGPRRRAKVPLLACRDAARPDQLGIPFTLRDYLEIVEWTGRRRCPDKPGSIDRELPALALRLRLNTDVWLQAMRPRGNMFGRAIGRLERLRMHAQTLGQSWVRGLGYALRMFQSSEGAD